VQNLLETLLNSGIPVEKHHYNEMILSNRMWPITNQQTPSLAILGQKITWPVKNTIPVQKQKLLPLFVIKGQKVK
jgi:hypothetical protein